MTRNILGVKVPEGVISCAMKHRSIKCPSYVYRDEEYGGALPIASIGCEKATHFKNPESALKNKIFLDDERKWVAFESPSAGKEKQRSRGAGIREACEICQEDRFTEQAHFPERKVFGGTVTISLCPTHHRLLDNGIISFSELESLIERRYTDFESVEKFLQWANDNGYAYTISDILNKRVYDGYEYKIIQYNINNAGHPQP